tara:strand:- start:161 stop:481 length:321 start_codon:yes stop_codon:yes gene_type:complete
MGTDMSSYRDDADLVDWVYDQDASYVYRFMDERMADTLRELLAAAISGDTVSPGLTDTLCEMVAADMDEQAREKAQYDADCSSGCGADDLDDDNKARAASFRPPTN